MALFVDGDLLSCDGNLPHVARVTQPFTAFSRIVFSKRFGFFFKLALEKKKNLRPEDHTRYQVAKRRETTE